METAVAQIKKLAASADKATRRQYMDTLYALAHSLEDADDTVNRFGYLHLQTASVKIGFDLGLFKLLSDAPGPVTTDEIARKTGAGPLLMTRYLRYLSGIGAIAETSGSQGEYAPNRTTLNLSEKIAEAGISHCFETIGPQYQAIPSFLKLTSYANPHEELHTVFQQAWHTTEHQFAWFSHQPEKLAFFNDYMASRREPAVSWLSVYPVRETVLADNKPLDPTRALYVNVGGGIGHQCKQFRDRFPAADMPGRVVLQDLPHTVANALPTPGVENMAHDFFAEQPVTGAKFYFLRGVLHNHPNHKVLQLLGHLKAAMAPDSVLLLDEWVLPARGASAYSCAMDLTMMAAFAGMERTEDQWRELLAQAGLTLVKTYTYNPLYYESVMDVRLL